MQLENLIKGKCDCVMKLRRVHLPFEMYYEILLVSIAVTSTFKHQPSYDVYLVSFAFWSYLYLQHNLITSLSSSPALSV